MDLPKDATLIEIRGVYDGYSAILMPNGDIVNRWRGMPGWERQERATDDWLAEHGLASSTTGRTE